jgi:predicted nucleotidyltransferase
MSEQDDWDGYIEAWRKRLAQKEAQRQMQTVHLRKVARACARRLVRDFGADRVYLFGSLLQENLVHDQSDIDLAVEGLKGQRYFAALSEMSALLPPGVELDLVRLERAWPSLVERIKAEGELLDAA